MTIKLKQSTASQEIPLGYFLDSLDGNTEETGLTIANTDIKLWKMGAITLANKNSGGATHISNGLYYAVLDATDTDTLGALVIFVHVAGALSIRVECEVLAANVYDSLIAASDNLQVDTIQIGGTTQTANDVGADVDAILVDTGTTLDDLIDTEIASIITTLGTPAGASLAADIAALPTAVENKNAVWDANLIDHAIAGTFGEAVTGTLNLTDDTNSTVTSQLDQTISSRASQASVNTVDDFLDTEVAAIITTLGTPAGVSISADIAAIEAQTDDIGAAGAGLTAVPWNAAWDAEVQSEVQDAIETNNLDHLVKAAVETNFATTVHLDSVIGQLADNGTIASFDRTTDSLEALQAEHDATQAAVDVVDNFLDTEVADILADTNELQTDWVNGGRLDLLIDAIKAKTDALPADPADDSDIDTQLATIAGYLDTEVASILAAVDTEVAAIKAVTDLLNTAYAEPTGAPAANETPLEKLAYIFMALRNKMTITGSAKSFYDDAGNVEWSKTLSDDGTTYTEAEGA